MSVGMEGQWVTMYTESGTVTIDPSGRVASAEITRQLTPGVHQLKGLSIFDAPWKHKDRNPFPTFVLFPRIAHYERLWARWRVELPDRLRGAWGLLRHGYEEGDER